MGKSVEGALGYRVSIMTGESPAERARTAAQRRYVEIEGIKHMPH